MAQLVAATFYDVTVMVAVVSDHVVKYVQYMCVWRLLRLKVIYCSI